MHKKYELTENQKGLFFDDMNEADISQLNVSSTFILDGEIDAAKLSRAIDIVISMHSSLRTSFHVEDGSFIQAIHDEVTFSLDYSDLTAIKGSKRESETERLVNHNAVSKFDLECPPLMRVALIKIGDNKFVISVAIHHIISDGWSLQVFTIDLMTTLQRLSGQDVPYVLAGKRKQYIDFVQRENKRLTEGKYREQEEYWNEKMSGMKPLDLPSDYKSRDLSEGKGQEISFSISGPVYTKFKNQLRELKVSSYAYLFTVFSIMMYKRTGERLLCIPTPFGDRPNKFFDFVIGYFVNSPAFRIEISEGIRFNELATAVFNEFQDVCNNSDYPSSLIYRSRGHHQNQSFLDISFGFDVSTSEDDLKTDGLGFSVKQYNQETLSVPGKFILLAEDTEKEIKYLIQYNESLFDRETIIRYADFFRRTVEAAVADSLFVVDSLLFEEFSDWQDHCLYKWAFNKEQLYWKDQLSGALPVLNLPADALKEGVEKCNRSSRKVCFSKELWSCINDLAIEYQCSVKAVITSVVNVLLFKYTGQEDIIIGSDNDGNIVANRNCINGSVIFSDFLAAVNETHREASENSQFSFEQHLNDLNILNKSSLFEVIVGFNPEPNDIFNGQWDLVLEFKTDDGFSCNIDYNSDIFLKGRIQNMIDHMGVLFDSVVSHPEVSITELEVLSSKEREKLLLDFNNTKAAYPENKCIHELFEEQVEKTPENIAAVFGSEELSFRELNNRANQLAHYLRDKGVNPESMVGIYIDRSLEMLIGLLGILKAGGVYVPIDPTYPEDRIQYMITDSNCKVIISLESLASQLLADNAEIICLDSSWKDIKKNSCKNVSSGVSPSNLVYVIYTSGSTGKPKGVMVEHGNLVNLICSMQDTFQLSESDAFLAITPYSFDIHALELYLPLMSGAKLVIASKKTSSEVPLLKKALSDHNISIMQATPVTWKMLIISNWECENPLIVLCGGEEMSESLKNSLSAQDNIQLWNMYGPTETTVWSSIAPISSPKEKVTIGKPIHNTTMYVLNKELELLPPGVPGELYIGGDGVTRGYFKRDDLTAKSFIPSPFADTDGTIIYRTGDLAKWLPCGNIMHLGRIDNQVKIRGFRIELGEIEYALSKIDSVEEAVVVAKDDVSGEKRLVAYIVSERELKTGDMKEELNRSLPDYMIPSLFIKTDAMPLTPNGKVDKKVLINSKDDVGNSKEYAAPTNETEEHLVRIWEEAFGIEQIGINDNFFELGGHSLLATLVVTKIRKEFNIQLPLKMLFELPDLKNLAEYVKNRESLGEEEIIPRASGEEPIPLSFAQERLWFLDQFERNSSYNMPGAIRLKGRLNRGLLIKTLNEIVKRHEILRTNFITTDGVTSQIIHEPKPCHITTVDQSQFPEAEAEKAVAELMKTEAKRVFDLASDDLIRFVIYKINDENHIIFLNKHHIISDGWSFSVLFYEISAIYEDLSKNRPVSLPELEIQYADYSFWQREYLKGEVLEKQLTYWKNNLSDTSVLELPLDKLRPAEQTFNGSNFEFKIDKAETDLLIKLSKENGVTLFMTLLSILNVLLHKYTGQDDICIGTPIANRTRSEVEPLIGFFINTLALRSDLSKDSSFTELLRQVKETTLNGYENQDVPFEKVVDIVGVERNLSTSPLFQVLMNLQSNPETELIFNDLKLELIDIDTSVAKFDLTFNFTETDSGLLCGLNYNTDLFEKETILRMADHFSVLLDSIFSDPDQTLSQLNILTPEEKQRLLIDFNDTQTLYVKDKCIHQLFEEQVESTPDNIALVLDNQELTYRELNNKANQLAHYLLKKGIKPDTITGICLERSFEMIIGMLGILKAGGGYVPVDPAYPRERIDYIISDSHCRILLSSEKVMREYNTDSCEIICLDKEWDKIKKEPSDNAETSVSECNTAYVIYTSGSTGKPKGVVIQHRNIVDYSCWAKNKFLGNEKLNFPLFTSFAFDLTITSVYPPLVSGNSIIIYQDDDIASLMPKIVSDERVGIIKLTPAHLEIVKYEKFSNSIRCLISGGDILTVDLVSTVLNNNDQLTIYNHYGPTEATVGCVCHKYNPEEAHKLSVPIGFPAANTSLYVVDKNMNPVPVGVPGELCIAGAGLAGGYLNNHALTEEKFIQNPFKNDSDSRLYRTGDLVKYLPSGNIEFIGRIDHQVKIRGFRIELGEVESALNQFNEIKDSVVVAKADSAGNKRLAAYFVSDAEYNIQDIRSKLSQFLPEYMIPSLFVKIDEIPLNSIGKINRKALPDPETHFETSTEYAPPTNEIEEKLVCIWGEILGIEQVGINDNFFESGGHSLLATQLVSKVRKEFNVEIPLKKIFELPAVKSQAEFIENSEPCDEITIVSRTLGQGAVPLSFSQERLWFLDQYERNSSYNMPGAIRLTGRLDIDLLVKTFSEIVKRHEILRTNFKTIDGVISQVIHEPARCEVQLIDKSHLSEREANKKISELMDKESQKVFDLESDSLIRFLIYRIHDENHVIFLNKHHIISDGWSFSVLFNEISAIYDDLSQNRPVSLPPLDIQYADYSIWQRNYLKGEVLDKQLEYWKDNLLNTPVLELPVDKVRPAEQSFNGSTYHFKIDKAVTEKLNELSKDKDVTLFMTLLSLFNVLLYKYSGQDDICIGTPIANRTRSEVEPLIGFFVNTLALRSRFSENSSFSELLSQIKETTLNGYEHQHVPFEKIVEALGVHRDLAYSPLFQVMMILQNNPEGELLLGDLKLEHLDVNTRIAKFDLTFNFTETASGLQCGIEYNTDLFIKETIVGMAEHFKVLVESVISDSEQSISELNILLPEEKQRVLVDFNQTQSHYDKDKCIHQLFEEQVEKFPENTALIFNNEELTYRELNNRANQLANYLLKKGVQTETTIAICLDRSFEMIIGILGVLKAGGGYVPVDPAYPRERADHIISDSNCQMILSSHTLESKFQNSTCEIIYMDRDFSPMEKESTENLNIDVKPDNLSYIIYTSGSTGKPKGVMIQHNSLVNYISWAGQQYTGDEKLNFPLFTSFSFDLTVTSIFVPLTSGNTIIGYSDNDIMTVLPQIISDTRIGIIKLTPAHLELVKYEVFSESVKCLILGGDNLSVNLATIVTNMNPNITIYNEYGPTEATVGCMIHKFDPYSDSYKSVPIGIPAANTTLYVLDKEMKPVAQGIPGELCIGGDGLARGYINRPDLTSEKFVQNPFDDSSKLYRSGDLVKFLSNGKLSFIGRIDSQVKIRGFRIEPGEIESAINSLQMVDDAVVLAKEDSTGNKRLVAYLVSGSELNISDIRTELTQSLPDYMIPSLFVQIDDIPLTSNGKINKKALPDPESHFKTSQEYEAPGNDTEKRLVTLWEEVLGVEQVGINDNFFELGGHSLLTIEMVTKINGAFENNISISDLFKRQTVKLLSEKLLTEERSEWTPLIHLQTEGELNPLYCIAGSAGHPGCFIGLSNYLGKNQPLYGLQYSGIDEGTTAHNTVEEIARENIKAIKQVQPTGPYHLAGHSLGGLVAFEMAVQLLNRGDKVAGISLFDSMSPEVLEQNSVSATDNEIIYIVIKTLEEFIDIESGITRERIADMDIDESYNLFSGKIGEMKGQNLFIDRSMFRGMCHVLKVQKNFKYRPAKGLYDIPMTLYRSEENENGSHTLGWDEYSAHDVIIKSVPGTHIGMIREPHVRTLAELMKEEIKITVLE